MVNQCTREIQSRFRLSLLTRGGRVVLVKGAPDDMIGVSWLDYMTVGFASSRLYESLVVTTVNTEWEEDSRPMSIPWILYIWG